MQLININLLNSTLLSSKEINIIILSSNHMNSSAMYYRICNLTSQNQIRKIVENRLLLAFRMNEGNSLINYDRMNANIFVKSNTGH